MRATNKLILYFSVMVLGCTTIIPTFAFGTDIERERNAGLKGHAELDQQNARGNAYSKVTGLLAIQHQKLDETYLALDLMKTSNPELVSRIFKNRKSSAAVSIIAGSGALAFSYVTRTAVARKAVTENGVRRVLTKWVTKPATQLSAATGIVLIGTGIYISFSKRAKVYEEVLAEIAKMSDDEKALYTMNKADQFDLVYAQVQSLTKVIDCIKTAEDFDECLSKIVIK